MGKYGVYGESAIVPAFSVAQYPDNLSPIEGAAIWMQYLTAFGALVEFGQLQKERSGSDHGRQQQRRPGRNPDRQSRRSNGHRHHQGCGQKTISP